MNQSFITGKFGMVSQMASVPKHPHHDDKHSRHAADLSHHTQRLGFSIDNLDPSADPRQDFYRFAAGGWLDKAVISDEDAQVGGFIGLYHLLNKQILSLLQDAAENSAGEPAGTIVQQVGDLFASAMDVERLDELGFTPLQPELARIEDIANMSDLAVVLAHLISVSGQPFLLTPAVIPDKKQSDMNLLQLYPGQLSLPNRDFYVNEAFDAVLESFVDHISEMLQLAGIAPEDASSQAEAILSLEKALAAATLSPVEAADPAAQYHKMPMSELLPLVPRFDFDAYFSALGLTLDGDINVAGSTLPTDINAAYQPQANKIEVSAAILQPPFFYPDLDMAVNFGAIGAVIGHEITHGFDSIGRRFDAKGNMVDWWTPGDSEEFAEMTGQLVEQFNGYEVLPDLFCNGQLTVTENTADLGGVTLAFAALQEALAGQPQEKIDGYSPQERFFISWAQLWMSKTRPQILQQLINADPHAPSAFRATGALVNLDAFFETFGIQSGNRMWRNESERVQIW